MKHTISRAALAAALVLGVAATAGAQTSPPPAPPAPPAPAAAPAGPAAAPAPPAAPAPAPPAPGAGAPHMPGFPGMPDPAQIRREIRVHFAADGGARALNRAYRTIGEAEALNGRSPYVGQARGHYTSAYARYRRGDATGTTAEAMAAAALAQAALDDRPPYTPRGLEAPPTPAPRARPDGAAASGAPGGAAMGGAPTAGVQPPGAPELPRVLEITRGVGRPNIALMHGFDASSLQALVALENTAEVRTLAERANAAEASAQRALASNDREGARRQERLAHDLAIAVHGITAADHPGQMPGRMPRRPLGAPGTVGSRGGTLDLGLAGLDMELAGLDLNLARLDPLLAGFDLPGMAGFGLSGLSELALPGMVEFGLQDELMDGLLEP